MCVFGVGPMFLGFYTVCRGWLFGDNTLILLQTEEIKAVTSCSTHKIDQQETDG